MSFCDVSANCFVILHMYKFGKVQETSEHQTFSTIIFVRLTREEKRDREKENERGEKKRRKEDRKKERKERKKKKEERKRRKKEREGRKKKKEGRKKEKEEKKEQKREIVHFVCVLYHTNNS